MILAHETSDVVVRHGGYVQGVRVGDSICMEPRVPNTASCAALLTL